MDILPRTSAPADPVYEVNVESLVVNSGALNPLVNCSWPLRYPLFFESIVVCFLVTLTGSCIPNVLLTAVFAIYPLFLGSRVVSFLVPLISSKIPTVWLETSVARLLSYVLSPVICLSFGSAL